MGQIGVTGGNFSEIQNVRIMTENFTASQNFVPPQPSAPDFETAQIFVPQNDVIFQQQVAENVWKGLYQNNQMMIKTSNTPTELQIEANKAKVTSSSMISLYI